MGLQAPPRGPPRGAPTPKGIVNRARDTVSPMRTHTFSISLSLLESAEWTACIVQTTLKAGVVTDKRIVWGPVWFAERSFWQYMGAVLEQLRKLVAEDDSRIF